MKSKSSIRTFIIGLVIIVLLTVILVILMSHKNSTRNVLTPLVVPIKGWFRGDRGNRGGNTTIVVGGSNSSSGSVTVPEVVPEVVPEITSPM